MWRRVGITWNRWFDYYFPIIILFKTCTFYSHTGMRLLVLMYSMNFIQKIHNDRIPMSNNYSIHLFQAYFISYFHR